jgi:putative DNA primase/helicase
LIQLGLDGLKRVLENQGFTISAKVQKEIDDYEINNNPILLFLKEDVKIINEPTKDVYRHYTEFCIANSFTPMSNIEFSKVLRKKLGLDIIDKTINRKKYRIFALKGA